MPDVLFIKTSSLGDVIHHMPALTEARRQRPAARFCWVVEEAFAPLVQIHPAVSQVIPVASRRWRRAPLAPSTVREIARFGRAVRTRRYDDIIDTQGLVRSALMARLARGRRHGYDANSVRERAASWFYDVQHRVARDLHAIARNRMLTGLALGYAPGGAVDYGLSRKGIAETTGEPYGILFHATARPEKEWPEASWIALGRALGGRGGSLLLPWGTEAEHARSKRIAAALSNACAPERQPLDRMAALIAGASFVIGVDTGLIHLAAALGVPLVAIFTASEPGLTGPMGHGPIVVVGGKHERASVSEVVDAFERLT
ncbi:MAG TPA: lipopolysaccharide heptosyltransferase I [Xanthobacteraceae bacterium]|nr:lipopolysaccharide heptosyltransferase I [Xanthobacteraceae bacterium]